VLLNILISGRFDYNHKICLNNLDAEHVVTDITGDKHTVIQLFLFDKTHYTGQPVLATPC